MRFLVYLLNIHKNIFFVSFYLTQICSFLKENLDHKPPISFLYSRLFHLNKTKKTTLRKETLYFFLIFRQSFLKLSPKHSYKDKIYQYTEIVEILRKLFRDYEIFNDFMVLFLRNSANFIRNSNVFLENMLL